MGNSSGTEAGTTGGGTGGTISGPLIYNTTVAGLDNHYISLWVGGLDDLTSVVKSLGNIRGTQSIFSFLVHLESVPTAAELDTLRSLCAAQKTTLYSIPNSTTGFVISPAVKTVTTNAIRFMLRANLNTEDNLEHCVFLTRESTVSGKETMSLPAPRLLSAIVHAETNTLLYTVKSPDVARIANFQLFTNFPAFETISLYPFTTYNSAANVSTDYDYCMAYTIADGDLASFIKLTNSVVKALNASGTSLIVSIKAWHDDNSAEYAYAYMTYLSAAANLNFNKYTYGNNVYVYNRMAYKNNTVDVPGMSIALVKDSAVSTAPISFNVSNGTLVSSSSVLGIVNAASLYSVSISGGKGSTVYVWNGQNGSSFDAGKTGSLTLTYSKITDKMQALKYVRALPPAVPVALLFSEWTSIFSDGDVTKLLDNLANYKLYRPSGGGKVGGLVHNTLITRNTATDNYIGIDDAHIRITAPAAYTAADVGVLQNHKFDTCSSNYITYYSGEACFKNSKSNLHCTVVLDTPASRTGDLDTSSKELLVLVRRGTMADVIDAFTVIRQCPSYKLMFLMTANRANDTADFSNTPLTRSILDLNCAAADYVYTKAVFQKYEYVFLRPASSDAVLNAFPNGLVLMVHNRPTFALSKETSLINHDTGRFNTKVDVELAPTIALIAPDFVKSTDGFLPPQNIQSTGIEYIYQVFNESLLLDDNTSVANRILDQKRTCLCSIFSDKVDISLNGAIFEYLSKKNNGIIFTYIRRVNLIALNKVILTFDDLVANYQRFDFALVFLTEARLDKLNLAPLPSGSRFKLGKYAPPDDEEITYVTITSPNINVLNAEAGLELRSSTGEERFAIVPVLSDATTTTPTVVMERQLKQSGGTSSDLVSVPVDYRYTLVEESLLVGMTGKVCLVERAFERTVMSLPEPRELYRGHPVYFNKLNLDELTTFISYVSAELERDPKYEFTCVVRLVPKYIGANADKQESNVTYSLDTDKWGIPPSCRVYKFSNYTNTCVFTTDASSQAFNDGFELTRLDRRFTFSEDTEEYTIPYLSPDAYTKYQQKRITIQVYKMTLSRDNPIYVHQYPVNCEWYSVKRQYSEATAPSIPEVTNYPLNSIQLLPHPTEPVCPLNYDYVQRSPWLPSLYIILNPSPLQINMICRFCMANADELKTTTFFIGPLQKRQFNIIRFPSTGNPDTGEPRIERVYMGSDENTPFLLISGRYCSYSTPAVVSIDGSVLYKFDPFSVKIADRFSSLGTSGASYVVYTALSKGCTDSTPGQCSTSNRKVYTWTGSRVKVYSSTREPIIKANDEWNAYPHVNAINDLEVYGYQTYQSPLGSFMIWDNYPSNKWPIVFTWPHPTLEPPIQSLMPDPAKNLEKHTLFVVSNAPINTLPLRSSYKITQLDLTDNPYKYVIVAHTIATTLKMETAVHEGYTYNYILIDNVPEIAFTSGLVVGGGQHKNGPVKVSIDTKKLAHTPYSMSQSRPNFRDIVCHLFTPK